MATTVSADIDKINTIPFVHLQCEHGHLVKAFVNPKISTGRISDASKHQLIPLKIEGGQISVIDLGWSLTRDGYILDDDQESITRSDFLHRLSGDSWKYVAIRNPKGKFLSNRRPTYIPGLGWTSLTEYRAAIGEFEIFQIEFDPETGYFSFNSHSGMYLQLNHTFYTTVCRPSKFLWKVSPLLKGTEERVEFVGVSRHGTSNNMETVVAGEFVIKQTAVDGIITERYIDPIKETVYKNLRPGQSHSFRGHNNGFWHYFLRGDKEELYMVVTTAKFSSAYATEFIEDLPPIFNKYVAEGEERDATNERLHAHGKDNREMMNSQIRKLMFYYDMENEKYIPDELREIMMVVEQNISTLRDNREHIEAIIETSTELLEQTEVFKKKAANLKDKRSNTLVLATGITAGAVVGASIGFVVFGLPGVYLATEGAEIGAMSVVAAEAAEIAAAAAAGAGIGLVGAAVSVLPHPRMWKIYVPKINLN